MEGTSNATQEDEGGDEVPQTQVTIVNEADLEGVSVHPRTAAVSYLWSRRESLL